MNTYLSAKPTFTSPQPLAAASSLTIPLQITLSEIKLSAFIILVFSKQKGLTLVFRNDPLESLKVSSTFDSIQFVRDYLQRTIEAKLRTLMMDELPAIIHRLSLQLWCPDQVANAETEPREGGEVGVNPLATPPLDPVDANGRLVDPSAISELSLDGGPEAQSLFSQKNLQRLSDLMNAQVTSALSTPSVSDVMFRAWAGSSDKVDASITPPVSSPHLVRTSSYSGKTHTYTFSDSGSQDQDVASTRPSIASLASATAGLSLGSGRHNKPGRKKKTRVVNLRRKPETKSEAGSEASETASLTAPLSEPVIPHPTLEPPEEEPAAAVASRNVRFRRPSDARRQDATAINETTLPTRQQHPQSPTKPQTTQQQVSTPVQSKEAEAAAEAAAAKAAEAASKNSANISPLPDWRRASPFTPFNSPVNGVNSSGRPLSMSDTSSVILEQAWIMKMAGEIARRVYDEKARGRLHGPSFWDDDVPPPAYDESR